jgi:hypothetical protein
MNFRKASLRVSSHLVFGKLKQIGRSVLPPHLNVTALKKMLVIIDDGLIILYSFCLVCVQKIVVFLPTPLTEE